MNTLDDFLKLIGDAEVRVVVPYAEEDYVGTVLGHGDDFIVLACESENVLIRSNDIGIIKAKRSVVIVPPK